MHFEFKMSVFFSKELHEYRIENIYDKLVWMEVHRFKFDLIWLPVNQLNVAIIRLN